MGSHRGSGIAASLPMLSAARLDPSQDWKAAQACKPCRAQSTANASPVGKAVENVSRRMFLSATACLGMLGLVLVIVVLFPLNFSSYLVSVVVPRSTFLAFR